MKKIKEISLVLVFQVVNLLISIFFIPYFLSKFSNQSYGLVVLVSQVISFVMFLDIGIASFLTQKLSSLIARPNPKKGTRLVASSIGLLLIISLILIPIIILLIINFEKIFSLDFYIPIDTKLLIGASMVVSLINLFSKPYTSLLFSEEKMVSLTFLSNLSFVLYSILSVIFVYINLGINSFFYALVISNLFYLFSVFVYFIRYKRQDELRVALPKKKEILYFINGGFFLFVNGIASQIIYNGDRILVAKFVSVGVLTLFTINIRIIEIIQVLIMKISDFYIPKIIKSVALTKETAVRYFTSFTKLTVVIVCFIIINFLLFNASLIKLWVGSDMIIDDYSVIGFYLIVCFSNIVFRIPSLFLYASGKNKQYSLFSILDAVINIILSIFLVKYYELKGIVLASIISTFLTSVPSNLWLFKKQFNINDYYTVLVKPILLPLSILSPIIFFGYVFSVKLLMFIDNWLELIVLFILFNLFLIPIIILLNYKKITLFINELKLVNNDIYRREITS